jgi:hypothetical protein
MRRLLMPNLHPSGVLLGVQLAAVLIYPFIDQTSSRAVVSLFGLIALALAVRAVQVSPALTWISLLLGIPIVLLALAQVADPRNDQIALVSAALFAAFYFYTSYALIRYMYVEREVTRDTLYATGATFTVVAWAFAYAYQAVSLIWPGSFSTPATPGLPPSWFDLLFLSFTTLSSVGLSDIVPILPNARSIVMLEEVAGVLYIALIVSRVVGLNLVRRGEAAEAAVAATQSE